MLSKLNQIEIERNEVMNISWTNTEKSQDNLRNSPKELPSMPPESSFQTEHNNLKRRLVILQDA